MIVEQIAKTLKLDGTLDKKKSNSKRNVFIIRDGDRAGTRSKIGKKLKSYKIKYSEPTTNYSSEKVTLIKNDDGKDTYVVYKPKSGGMTETTLNSTITELVPCIMFLKKIKGKNVDKVYTSILSHANDKKLACYVSSDDFKAGKDFIEDMPKSSKFSEKMSNALAIHDYLQDTHKHKNIQTVYWTYRGKPKGVDPNSPADIVIEFKDKKMLGVSLKAGGESTKEPLLNTYVNKVGDLLDNEANKKKLRRKLFDDVYSSIDGITNRDNYDKGTIAYGTKKILADFEDNEVDLYNEKYDEALEICRNYVMKVFSQDTSKFIDYARANILKEVKDGIPIVIIKAFGKSYKEVKDGNRLGKYLAQLKTITAEASSTSKQNFFLHLKDAKKKRIATMNMSIRSNKVGESHKLGQFFNLAVKYNGLND